MPEIMIDGEERPTMEELVLEGVLKRNTDGTYSPVETDNITYLPETLKYKIKEEVESNI